MRHDTGQQQQQQQTPPPAALADVASPPLCGSPPPRHHLRGLPNKQQGDGCSTRWQQQRKLNNRSSSSTWAAAADQAARGALQLDGGKAPAAHVREPPDVARLAAAALQRGKVDATTTSSRPDPAVTALSAEQAIEQQQVQQLRHGLAERRMRRWLQRWQQAAADVALEHARARPMRSLLGKRRALQSWRHAVAAGRAQRSKAAGLLDAAGAPEAPPATASAPASLQDAATAARVAAAFHRLWRLHHCLSSWRSWAAASASAWADEARRQLLLERQRTLQQQHDAVVHDMQLQQQQEAARQRKDTCMAVAARFHRLFVLHAAMRAWHKHTHVSAAVNRLHAPPPAQRGGTCSSGAAAANASDVLTSSGLLDTGAVQAKAQLLLQHLAQQARVVQAAAAAPAQAPAAVHRQPEHRQPEQRPQPPARQRPPAAAISAAAPRQPAAVAAAARLPPAQRSVAVPGEAAAGQAEAAPSEPPGDQAVGCCPAPELLHTTRACLLAGGGEGHTPTVDLQQRIRQARVQEQRQQHDEQRVAQRLQELLAAHQALLACMHHARSVAARSGLRPWMAWMARQQQQWQLACRLRQWHLQLAVMLSLKHSVVCRRHRMMCQHIRAFGKLRSVRAQQQQQRALASLLAWAASGRQHAHSLRARSLAALRSAVAARGAQLVAAGAWAAQHRQRHVLLAWHRHVDDQAHEHTMAELSLSAAAVAWRTERLRRTALCGWRAAARAAAAERRQQAQHQQTWQRVQGWLTELEQQRGTQPFPAPVLQHDADAGASLAGAGDSWGDVLAVLAAEVSCGGGSAVCSCPPGPDSGGDLGFL